MQSAKVIERIRRKYRVLRPEMGERMRRQWAAAEARELGWGGVTAVGRATGLSRTTITAGRGELDLPAERRASEAQRVRRPGGGRKPLTRTDPALLAALEGLIEPVTRGDPQSPLRWTLKSTRTLAAELTRERHPVSPRTVAGLLHQAGYSLQANRKTRSVGIDHDTAQCATNSIRRWWEEMGRGRFRRTSELLITADGGGSNGFRSRLWKVCLQHLADHLEMKLVVCHFPPGTSKWNAIEHRLFSFITQNWRSRPLVSRQAIVNLIAHTTTRTGLIVKAALDTNRYETAIKVTDQELASVRLKAHTLHGDWNYRKVRSTRPRLL